MFLSLEATLVSDVPQRLRMQEKGRYWVALFPGEEEDAKEVASYIEKAGRKVVLLPYDLREETAPKEMIQKSRCRTWGLDTLVLNAGQQISSPSIVDLPMEQVKDTFMVNIIAMFALVKEAVPHIPAGGAIVTTTSVQASNPSEHLLDYAATKSSNCQLYDWFGKTVGTEGNPRERCGTWTYLDATSTR